MHFRIRGDIGRVIGANALLAGPILSPTKISHFFAKIESF